jgi:lysophospholipase L1-like esterase
MRAKKLTIVVTVLLLVASLVTLIMFNLETNKASTPTNALSLPIKVACIGDSITENSQYTYDLQAMLGSNYTVCNFGCSESTVLRISWKPYMNQTEFQRAIDFDPDIIIIMLGTNDGLPMLQPFNDTFEEDYTTLVNSFQQLPGDEQIFIVKSPPVFGNSTDLNATFQSETIVPKIENVAANLNLPVVDVYGICDEHPDYFEDGVHPNSQGSALIAFEVYGAINQQDIPVIDDSGDVSII